MTGHTITALAQLIATALFVAIWLTAFRGRADRAHNTESQQ